MAALTRPWPLHAGRSRGSCLLDLRFANKCCLVHLHKVWPCVYFFRGHLVTSPQKANLSVTAVKKTDNSIGTNQSIDARLGDRGGGPVIVPQMLWLYVADG